MSGNMLTSVAPGDWVGYVVCLGGVPLAKWKFQTTRIVQARFVEGKFDSAVDLNTKEAVTDLETQKMPHFPDGEHFGIIDEFGLLYLPQVEMEAGTGMFFALTAEEALDKEEEKNEFNDGSTLQFDQTKVPDLITNGDAGPARSDGSAVDSADGSVRVGQDGCPGEAPASGVSSSGN